MKSVMSDLIPLACTHQCRGRAVGRLGKLKEVGSVRTFTMYPPPFQTSLAKVTARLWPTWGVVFLEYR